MVVASQLRTGMAVRFDGQEYKVAAAEYRPGQGRMSGAMHTRLRNLETGTTWEHAFRSELKLEEIPVSKHTMEFLYAGEDFTCFMDPDNYEQTEIPNSLIGVQARFLQAGMRLPVRAWTSVNLGPAVRLEASGEVAWIAWTAARRGRGARVADELVGRVGIYIAGRARDAGCFVGFTARQALGTTLVTFGLGVGLAAGAID